MALIQHKLQIFIFHIKHFLPIFYIDKNVTFYLKKYTAGGFAVKLDWLNLTLNSHY
jgi:hypothetical protein